MSNNPLFVSDFKYLFVNLNENMQIFATRGCLDSTANRILTNCPTSCVRWHKLFICDASPND